MKFPLASLIFLKRSLVFPILLFSSISLHWSPRKSFLSLLAILWNSGSKWVYLSLSPLPVIVIASLSFLPFKVKLLKGQLFLVSFTPLAVHSSNHSNLGWASTISLKQMTKSYYVSQFKECFYSSSYLTIKKMQSGHVAFLTLTASQCFKDKEHVPRSSAGPESRLPVHAQWAPCSFPYPALTQVPRLTHLHSFSLLNEWKCPLLHMLLFFWPPVTTLSVPSLHVPF